MATQGRDDEGQFSEKMRTQDLLKAFDFEATDEDPYLTVREVREALARHWDIDVTDEAVRARLEALCDDDTVARRKFGPSTAYRALVGPELAAETEQAVAATDGELDGGETVSHEELFGE